MTYMSHKNKIFPYIWCAQLLICSLFKASYVKRKLKLEKLGLLIFPTYLPLASFIWRMSELLCDSTFGGEDWKQIIDDQLNSTDESSAAYRQAIWSNWICW